MFIDSLNWSLLSYFNIIMLTGGASRISQRGAPTFKGSTNPKGGINLLSSQISRKLHGNEENWMEKLGVIQYFNTHVKIQQPSYLFGQKLNCPDKSRPYVYNTSV